MLLLLGGAYFAALPWAGCAFSLGRWVPDVARICTFGTGNPAFVVPGPYWPNLVIAALYLAAAAWVARTRRIDFASTGSRDR